MKNSTRRLLGGLTAFCAVSAFANPTFAETLQEKAALIPAAAFAQLPAMDNVQLSPGGSYMAYETAHDGRVYAVVLERASGEKKALPPISEANIKWYRWVNDTGILISYGFENRRVGVEGRGVINEARLAYYDPKKDKFRWVVKEQGSKYSNSRLKGDSYTAQFQDRIIDFLPDNPEEVLQALDSDWDGDYEVRRLNVTNGSYSVVYPGTRGIQSWMTDANHEIRYGTGFQEGVGYVVRYRSADGQWMDAFETDWYKKGFRPLDFSADPAVAYVTGPSSTERNGLFKMNLDTGAIVEEVLVHDEVDVDGLYYAGNDGLPVAAAYTHFASELSIFDDYTKKLHAFIDKSLPNTRNRVVSQLPSLRQYVILAESGRDAGIYYLLDLKKKSLDALAERMPGLTPEYMAAAQPKTFEARDGSTVPGYLTLPAGSEGKKLPTVILVHDGPHARADANFNPLVQFLASRGYAVYQPNYRGSDGYGYAYLNKGYKQWGGLMQDDITDAAKALADEGIADAGNICVMGKAYGGYAAALASVKAPNLFKCAISVNAILDLPGYISNGRYSYVGGKATVEHIGLKDSDPGKVSPYHLADSLTAPIMIVAAEDDAIVDASQARRMHDKLQGLGKSSSLMMLPEGGHNLDTAPARTVFYEKLERFLEKHLNTQVAEN